MELTQNNKKLTKVQVCIFKGNISNYQYPSVLQKPIESIIENKILFTKPTKNNKVLGL